MNTKTKKIEKYCNTNIATLDDRLLCIASTIEDGILQAGGSNTEYTVTDLFKMAIPFAAEDFKSKGLTFTTGYPA